MKGLIYAKAAAPQPYRNNDADQRQGNHTPDDDNLQDGILFAEELNDDVLQREDEKPDDERERFPRRAGFPD